MPLLVWLLFMRSCCLHILTDRWQNQDGLHQVPLTSRRNTNRKWERRELIHPFLNRLSGSSEPTQILRENQRRNWLETKKKNLDWKKKLWWKIKHVKHKENEWHILFLGDLLLVSLKGNGKRVMRRRWPEAAGTIASTKTAKPNVQMNKKHGNINAVIQFFILTSPNHIFIPSVLSETVYQHYWKWWQHDLNISADFLWRWIIIIISLWRDFYTSARTALFYYWEVRLGATLLSGCSDLHKVGHYVLKNLLWKPNITATSAQTGSLKVHSHQAWRQVSMSC